MINAPQQFFILMVQYQPGEGPWSLYHVFEDYTEAKYFMRYAMDKDIKAGFKQVYKIFTYKFEKIM